MRLAQINPVRTIERKRTAAKVPNNGLTPPKTFSEKDSSRWGRTSIDGPIAVEPLSN